MSMTAALKAARAVEQARLVVAIELVCAAQGLDLLPPAAPVAARCNARTTPIRARVAHLDRDRPPAPDIEAIAAIIADGTLERTTAIEVKEKKLNGGR